MKPITVGGTAALVAIVTLGATLRSGHRSPAGTRRRGALTLVEILVVIAIIAVLASLLFPVLARARESGKITASVNNLHQIGAATILYANDADDVLPFYRNDELLLLHRDPFVTTLTMPTDSKQPKELIEALASYLGWNNDVWFCSGDRYRGTQVPYGFLNHHYTSYSYQALPEGYDYNKYRQWPIVTSLQQLTSDGVLFFEPSSNWLGVDPPAWPPYWQSGVHEWLKSDLSIHHEIDFLGLKPQK